MQIKTYICDYDKTPLSDETKNIAKEHIILQVKEAGWMKKFKTGWGMKYGVKSSILHFCNPECLKKFFEELKANQYLLGKDRKLQDEIF